MRIANTNTDDDTTRHDKEIISKEQFELKTTINNKVSTKSGTKMPANLPQAIKKVTAYRLPQAKGKGDFIEAVEKDLLNPNPTFKNLSQLFKDKQREKFYAKN